MDLQINIPAITSLSSFDSHSQPSNKIYISCEDASCTIVGNYVTNISISSDKLYSLKQTSI